MLLVHAVLRAGDARAVDRAVDRAEDPGARLQALAAGDLAAVVSEVDEHALTADDAVAHLDLLVSLVADVPVLPLPMGTTAPDERSVVEEVLEPVAGWLREQLAAVADLVELRLDLTFDVDALLARLATEDPETARLVARSRGTGGGLSDRLALGEAVAARVADEEALLTEEWTRALAGVSTRWTVLGSDEQRWRMAYLVRRDRLAAADAAVADLRGLVGAQAAVEYVGPLPVYSFLDQIPAAGTAAPSSRWGW